MKKASPIAGRFTQTKIADGYPVPESTRSDQPYGKNRSKTTNNIKRLVGGAIVDDHQLDGVVMLVPHTLKCRGDEPLTVVRRHDNRQKGFQLLALDCDSKSFSSLTPPCPYGYIRESRNR